MAIPDYQTVMLPVLRAAADGEVRVSDTVEKLAGEFGLTEDERAELLPSGRQPVIYNRVQWAKTYLTRAGLLKATRRGHFEITDRGKNALAEHPQKIDNNYLMQFEEFIEFRQRSLGSKDKDEAGGTSTALPDDQTPDEIMRAAHRNIDGALRTELLERVVASPPDFFEQLVVTLLVEMGYGGSVDDAGRALGKSGDGGVDGVIDQDALGLDRVYIQAKRYAQNIPIGSPAIRDFSGSLDMRRATKGVFVTTSSFTKDALKTASQLSRHVVLINGDRLAALMIRYDVGVRAEEALYLKKIDEDFFPA